MPYDSNSYSNPVGAVLTPSSINDMGYAALSVGATPLTSTWRSGSTNKLILTPASGGTTITGIDASGCSDGFTMIIFNASSTDSITFSHLSGSSQTLNQISCANGAPATLAPLTGARITRLAARWTFA